MSLCDEDFLIACNGLDKSSMNNNLKNIQNKLSEMNIFSETTDEENSDIDKFDPDKNFTFEDNCEYVFNTNTNKSKVKNKNKNNKNKIL